MRKISVAFPDSLYAELREVAAATEERGYGPANWAGDLVASELAARRLPRMSAGRERAADKPSEPVTHRVLSPETRA